MSEFLNQEITLRSTIDIVTVNMIDISNENCGMIHNPEPMIIEDKKRKSSNHINTKKRLRRF